MNNNLIKQLSHEASTFASSKSPVKDSGISKEYFEYYNAKFAELLVLECANVCANFKYTDEGPSEGAAYQRALCKFAIKEHFGFERPAPLSPKVIR